MAVRKVAAVSLLTAAVVSIGISGCAGKSTTVDAKSDGTITAAQSPTMSAADLQKSLSGRISTATPPKSVTCAGGLTGEVGKTATCEVSVDDNTSIQANVTVTKVSGTTIDYDFVPSMTQAQLEKAFAANVSAQVSCDGGLEGKVGSNTTCHVTKDGTTNDTVVSVSKVQGLFMSLATSQP